MARNTCILPQKINTPAMKNPAASRGVLNPSTQIKFLCASWFLGIKLINTNKKGPQQEGHGATNFRLPLLPSGPGGIRRRLLA